MVSDILIIGGGIIALATAIELKIRGCNVTIVSRDFKAAATLAAAGMLAPDSEKILRGAMRDLCLRSRALYPEWTSKLEQLTGVNTGYWACGSLTPVYDVGIVEQDNHSYWLDKETIHQYQEGLGEEVIGGWWYPEDAQVDNRALNRALLTAAQSLGVEIKENCRVNGILISAGEITGIQTSAGVMSAEHYILAAGAWSNELFPLPVRPRKGQMLSLRVPDFLTELPLNRILYGEEIYIVPRHDRRIIIGATSEQVGFTPYNTPTGIQALLQNAIRLFPLLKDYSIEEMWWGYRPATPDELPILGESPYKNLTFATGHFRNGILLTPITALLIADQITKQGNDPLVQNFHYSRFQIKEKIITPMLTHSANFSNGSIVKNTSTQLTLPTPGAISDSRLQIAGKSFTSRLMTGTGKYRSIEEMQQSVVMSGCQIVTVAVRRVQTNAPGHEGLAEALDWSKIWMLPNTAGCKTAEEAVRVARLGREMAKLLGQEDNNFVKLEVIPDAKYLLPDPIGTLQAAEQLVKEGFAVLPYINADPILAQRLEEVGCATVMPLAAPIGSGQGIQTAANIQIIIENAKVPVVVDAGIGAPSEAAKAMEMGADALLINSAIALAQNAPAMAQAMNLAATAGRLAYLAGRMPIKDYASASSPLTGTIN
ncbi:thiazole synthase [Calothrix sp. NIES-4071]|nr:thiazole synthase [Calothrix sp. NIES-4071]BAZ58533.1 thiazole synthase [Calothrix sp. NIES-4105]